MKYMICAGEASGDLHASELIRTLQQHDADASFVFLGGDLMAQAAASKPLIHYRDMAFMGFIDVIRNIGKVRKNLNIAQNILLSSKPDALILVDYPSFNLRLAALAHAHNIPIYYYISPKVWAWKEYRTAKIAKYCKRVLSILPFEPEFYQKHGYDACSYVGNPSVEEIDRKLASASNPLEFKKRYRLNDKPIMAIVPGSRVGEIKRNLPIMLQAAEEFEPEYQIVIAGAPCIDRFTYRTLKPVIFNSTVELMHNASVAIVTSGTASLEAALAAVPQVVCYRHTGSRLTYALMSRILKIPFVTLPNLIAGKEVVPELLLHKCTPTTIKEHLTKILPNHSGRQLQMQGYELIREKLGGHGAAESAANLIVTDLLTK